MSKIEKKKTTWTVSPTRKKVIILILSGNTVRCLRGNNKKRRQGGANYETGTNKISFTFRVKELLLIEKEVLERFSVTWTS